MRSCCWSKRCGRVVAATPPSSGAPTHDRTTARRQSGACQATHARGPSQLQSTRLYWIQPQYIASTSWKPTSANGSPVALPACTPSGHELAASSGTSWLRSFGVTTIGGASSPSRRPSSGFGRGYPTRHDAGSHEAVSRRHAGGFTGVGRCLSPSMAMRSRGSCLTWSVPGLPTCLVRSLRSNAPRRDQLRRLMFPKLGPIASMPALLRPV